MPDKTPELLPCPHCPESELEIVGYWGGYRVKCWGCGCESGYYGTAENAMDAWNRRAQPKPEPQEGEPEVEIAAADCCNTACPHYSKGNCPAAGGCGGFEAKPEGTDE